MPAISIIIPTYNRSGLLSRALHSMLQQTFLDWECLVIDDGGSDDTSDVIAALGDDRINYIRIEHAGRSAARNIGFDNSSGNYIAFLDSDDELKKDFCRECVAHFESNPASMVVRVRSELVRLDGTVESKICDRKIPAVQKIWKCYSPVLSFSMRREVCEQIKWPEQFDHWEDTYYFLRIALNFEIAEIDKVLCTVHDHHERSLNMSARDEIQTRLEKQEYALKSFFREYADQMIGKIDWADGVDMLMSKYRTAATDAMMSGHNDLARAIMGRSVKYLRPRNAAPFAFTLGRVLTGIKPTQV